MAGLKSHGNAIYDIINIEIIQKDYRLMGNFMLAYIWLSEIRGKTSTVSLVSRRLTFLQSDNIIKTAEGVFQKEKLLTLSP